MKTASPGQTGNDQWLASGQSDPLDILGAPVLPQPGRGTYEAIPTILRALADTVESGNRPEVTLDVLAAGAHTRQTTDTCRAVAAELRSGHTLPDALRTRANFYPNVAIAVIAAGHQAGDLPAGLREAAEIVADDLAYRRRRTRMFLTAAGWSAATAGMASAAGLTASTARAEGVTGPGTWLLEALRYLPAVGIVLAVTAAALWVLSRPPSGREKLRAAVGKIELATPGLKHHAEARDRWRMALVAAARIRSGDTLAEALTAAAEAAENRQLAAQATAAAERIRAGENPVDTLRETNALGRHAPTALSAGFQNGSVPNMLRVAARAEREQASLDVPHAAAAWAGAGLAAATCGVWYLALLLPSLTG